MIEYVFSRARLDGNPVIAGTRLLRDLKDAGMPVFGVLYPVGAETGRLESVYDALDDAITFRWHPDL